MRRLGLLVLVVFMVAGVPAHAAFPPIQLTKSTAADRHPTWSADGSFIVFESNRSGSAWHLYRIPSWGGEETQISFDTASQMEPEISPDGTKIVYLQAAADLGGGISSSGISVMPTFGGSPTVLIPRDNVIRLLPTWSSDGSTIYFTRAVSTVGNWDIYKVSSTGGPETFVLDFGDDGSCDISPDGQTIMWANHAPSKPYNLVRVALANPVSPEQLTFETANTAQSDYSSDGSKIAYVSRKVLGKLDLFEMDLSTRIVTRLTFDADNSPSDPLNQFPTYSRDDERLAFSSARITGEQNIWVLPFVEPPAPPAGNLLSIGSGEGISGPGTVIIPVSLSSEVPTPALEFEVVDTPDWLHIVGVTARGRALGFTAAFSDEEKPHVVMYGASGQTISPGSGAILDLEYEVQGQAVEGDSTELSFDHIVMADLDGQPLTVEWKGNPFYVRRMSGDVNGDNQVDTGDLIRLVEFILKTGAPPTDGELEEADCNGDNMHNALDIVCLLDVVLSGPGRMHAATTVSNAFWTIRAEEPVRGLEFLTEGGDWSLTRASLAPLQLHQPRDLSLGPRAIFDSQGASWEAGSVRTFEAPSRFSGVKAFGAGGRSLPVRIDGNEIRIGAPLPSGLRVLPAAPNPFAGATSLAFSIDRPARVAVRVYDVRGALVASPEPRMLPAGRHVWSWPAKDNLGRTLPSGLYVAVVDSGTRRSAVRLNHLR